MFSFINSPCLIFTLQKSKTNLPSLEFANSRNPQFVTQSFIYKSISPVLDSPSDQRTKRGEIKRGIQSDTFVNIYYLNLYLRNYLMSVGIASGLLALFSTSTK